VATPRPGDGRAAAPWTRGSRAATPQWPGVAAQPGDNHPQFRRGAVAVVSGDRGFFVCRLVANVEEIR
jgi:hypothetical protein